MAQQTLGVFLNDSLSVNGYTLFSNNKTTYLIDNCGNQIHTWSSDFNSNTAIYLLENGNLVRTARVGGVFAGGGIGGRMEMFNWEGDLLWSYKYANTQYHQHHDIEPLPNGNFLILAWEARTQAEAIEAGRNPLILNPDGIWPERIIEVEPVGTDQVNIVWQWHIWDHLVQDIDLTKANYGVVSEHPELLNINTGGGQGGAPNTGKDWIHANAISYNPDLDQIAISSRHLNEIWIIDHSTTTEEASGHTGGNMGKGGDLLYRWGNPLIYNRGDDSSRTLFGQHNIQWIMEEDHPHYGKLLVYNNGIGRPEGNYSSLDIWTPPTDSDSNYVIDDSTAFGPIEADWTYFDGLFFSANTSGVHALPNGNLLACVGTKGLFFEINAESELVWEYVNPVSSQNGPLEQGATPNQNAMFRATRYPADYPAFEGRELNPGLPVELNPLPSDCVIHETVVAIENEQKLHGVWLRTNPISDEINIVNKTDHVVFVEIFDLTGRLVAEEGSRDELISLPSDKWVNGFYVLRITNENKTAFLTQKLIKN